MAKTIDQKAIEAGYEIVDLTDFYYGDKLKPIFDNTVFSADNPIHKMEFIGKGQVPDGYFGDYAKVDFYFNPESGNTIVRHETGYHTYITPKAINKKEAIWLLKHHPVSNVKFYQSINPLI